MKKNSREDVVLYLIAWAKILREKWVAENDPKLESKPEKKLKMPVLVYLIFWLISYRLNH